MCSSKCKIFDSDHENIELGFGDEGDRTDNLNIYNHYIYIKCYFLRTPKYTPKLIKITNFTKLILIQTHKKSREWFRSRGLQLPKEETATRKLKNKILFDYLLVNERHKLNHYLLLYNKIKLTFV